MAKTLLLNTKSTVHAAVEALDADAEVRMCLGLDGDCDFTRRVTDFVPYRCTKAELMDLIDAQADGYITTVVGLPQYLVLSRRHVAYLPDILQANPDGEHEDAWAL